MKKEFDVTRLWLCLGMGICMIVAGCGRVTGNGEQSAPLARVNDTLISQIQVDRALQRAGQPTTAARQMLDSLVDQQLLADLAEKERIDQDWAVKDALAAARRQVLTQALLEKHAAGKPSDDEIARYYDQHPILFSNRRVFTFRSINVVEPRAGLERHLKRELQVGKGLSELTVGLEAAGYKFRAADGTAGAEQIPDYLHADLQRAEAGDVVIAGNKQMLTVMNILAASPRSLSLAEAKPMIARYLENTKRAETAQQLLTALRKSARVEYLSSKQAETMGDIIGPPPDE
ncbi:EpsD family peptidyl-prolyl cis-trans isomerase [Chitinivorax sp. B]|uniref:EpsD family peptidyl-prolyl cis-trans isomerase n=1 Tax=Chitinivorax sp. B TaxID=2502235 RepID=UPI0010F49921|nr:EpsD family peptidyl-prolyl cis-trans isomerase [Chitinivorax sp. B]